MAAGTRGPAGTREPKGRGVKGTRRPKGRVGRLKGQGGLTLFEFLGDNFLGPISWDQILGTFFGTNFWDLLWDKFLGTNFQ